MEVDRKPKGAVETRRLLENDLSGFELRRWMEWHPGSSRPHHRYCGAGAVIALNFRAELARAWRYAVDTGGDSSATSHQFRYRCSSDRAKESRTCHRTNFGNCYRG